MVSTRKRNIRTQVDLSQLNEHHNNFNIGNSTNVDTIENDSIESQTVGLADNFGRFAVGENNASHDQAIEKFIADRIKKDVDNAVKAVESRVLDAILTAVDNVVKTTDKIAERSFIGPSGYRPNSVVQNLDRRDFAGDRENAPLMAVSNRADLNIDRDRNDEFRNVENFEECDFPALRHKHDRQTHPYHTYHKKTFHQTK